MKKGNQLSFQVLGHKTGNLSTHITSMINQVHCGYTEAAQSMMLYYLSNYVS